MAQTNTNEYLQQLLNNQGVNINDLLYALKYTMFKDLKVLSFGIVKKNNGNGTYQVSLFPYITGESVKNITAYGFFEHKVKIDNEEKTITELCSVNDIVLVGFADRNFHQSLKQALNTKKNDTFKLTTLNENSDLHSDNYGVILKIIKHQ